MSNNLGRALKQIRVFHSFKQKDLANKLGLSASYISEIEKGLKEPSLSVIDKYALIFNIPKSSILFFSENIDQPSNFKDSISAKILSMLEFISYDQEV